MNELEGDVATYTKDIIMIVIIVIIFINFIIVLFEQGNKKIDFIFSDFLTCLDFMNVFINAMRKEDTILKTF
jgi:hypothetical protein